jgi:DNA-directed RNA polymerase I, II, and III subunit RPABC1
MIFIFAYVKKMEYVPEEEVGTYGQLQIYRNLLKMLGDRGYIVEKQVKAAAKMDEHDFWYRGGEKQLEWKDLNEVFLHGDPKRIPLQTIWIPYIENSDKIKIDHITKELRVVDPHEKNKHYLFLSDKHLGNPASEKLDNLSDIEYWTYDRLRIPIPEHFLIDRVEIVPEPEVQEMMKRLQIQRSNFPRMSIQDPTTRWYGLEPGNVVRLWETAAREVRYRVVDINDYTGTPCKNKIFN